MGLFQDIGQELTVAAAFEKRGWIVCFPYQQVAPYDLIIEKDKQLYRVQVKKSRCCTHRAAIDGWAFKMKCLHCGNSRRYNRSEVDAFATVFDGEVYAYFLSADEKPPRSLPIKTIDLPKYKV